MNPPPPPPPWGAGPPPGPPSPPRKPPPPPAVVLPDGDSDLSGGSNQPDGAEPLLSTTPDFHARISALKPEEAGDRIGAYKLLQKLGEGGFGTVWMAEQEQPVRRRVALKVIKLGMDTREVIARFEQERQALALMDHPNIARVFDAGATEIGRPYFVMELARGMRITEYCDAQKLSTQQRIELFIQVCQAVQHAHQKGIIHRDLKPSNILVTMIGTAAVPKVIDFGVAKATQTPLTDLTLFTQFQQMIGTPLYMSPEQAELTPLDIDTRSDIYSLGVLLYELLTGATPIDCDSLGQMGLDEVRRVILEVDPPRPSLRIKSMSGEQLSAAAQRRLADPAKLRSQLQGDLDWIVMKCLEKDRNRRYETANGLARDLERFLKHEVVTARPPTAIYRFSKLVRRNRAAFTAGLVIFLVVLVGGAVSVILGLRAHRALRELRAAAPAFAAYSEVLANQNQIPAAIEKLEYASILRPDETRYLLGKANLLQSQLSFQEAATAYRAVLAIEPGNAAAATNARLCEELHAETAANGGKVPQLSLARLLLAMHAEKRPASQLRVASQLDAEGKARLLEHWHTKLASHGIVPPKSDAALSPDDKLIHAMSGRTFGQFLTVREDGLLALDLSYAEIADLAPLADVPLGSLDLTRCANVKDLGPLRGLPLTELLLGGSGAQDLKPLSGMRTLTNLSVASTGVADLSPLRGIPLKVLILAGAPITDINALKGMPIERLFLCHLDVPGLNALEGMPIREFHISRSPDPETNEYEVLARLPVERAALEGPAINDLRFIQRWPLRALILRGAPNVRNLQILSRLQELESIELPQKYTELPASEMTAIEDLRKLPKLQTINSMAKEQFFRTWEYASQSGELLARHRSKLPQNRQQTTRSFDALVNQLMSAGNFDEAERVASDVLALQAPTLETRSKALEERARILARRGLWSRALTDLDEAVSTHTGNHFAHYVRGAILIQLGEREGYRRHCTQFMSYFPGVRDPVVAERIAKLSLILPGSAEEMKAAAELADVAVTEGKGMGFEMYFLFAKGLAEYRVGNFTGCIAALNAAKKILSSSKLRGRTIGFFEAQCEAVFAMAQYRLGDREAAHAAFQRMGGFLDSHMPRFDSPDRGVSWFDWIFADTLAKEAAAVLKVP